jgi:amidase
MIDIAEVSVSQLRQALDTRQITIRHLVQACFDRIASMDRQGPSLHAVIATNPDALAIADRLDTELANGTARGPLHGIPVLLKDNIAATGMPNTAGSLALIGADPLRDSFVATRLRDAGAVLLGKTNLSEWANIRSSHSTSGWSGVGGQTRNPYQIDRNPSGSSSGSGVAVAASYAPLAVGTETNGSIVMPATVNGVVGVKPTVGLVSRMGIIPISHSQDTAGPMARSVIDAAMLLQVLAAPDPADPAWRTRSAPSSNDVPQPSFPTPPDGFPATDYVSQLDRDGLKGARIGVLRGVLGDYPHRDAVFEEALIVLRESGATLVDPVEIPARKALLANPDKLELMLWELGPGIRAYIEQFVDPSFPVRTLADVVRYNREHAETELRYFGQDLLEAALTKSPLDDPAYLRAAGTVQRMARAQGLDAALDAHRLDAIVAPTGGPANRIDLVTGDGDLGGTSTVAAVAGYPLVTVPAGYRFGLPVGITFMGRAWSEATLLRLAFAFEQATAPRRVPEYVPGSVIPPEH